MPTGSAPEPQISGRALAGALEGACRRCLWIALRRHKLPYSRFPGVFNTIDRFTKQSVHTPFDREGRLPSWFPEIGSVVDYVRDGSRLASWNFRVTDPASGVTLTGVPDDVFRMADGSYHIVDYKTARLTPAQDELFRVYEVQLNAYAYIADRVGLSPVSGLSLIYLDPDAETVEPAGGRPALRFDAKRKAVGLRPNALVPPLLATARAAYDLSRAPPPAATCEDCRNLDELVRSLRA